MKIEGVEGVEAVLTGGTLLLKDKYGEEYTYPLTPEGLASMRERYFPQAVFFALARQYPLPRYESALTAILKEAWERIPVHECEIVESTYCTDSYCEECEEALAADKEYQMAQRQLLLHQAQYIITNLAIA